MHGGLIGIGWDNAFVPGAWRGPYRGLPLEVPILTAVSFTVALGYGIVAPVIPEFARRFGVSTVAAASVVSVFALVRVAAALPAGRAVDRYGERAIMVVGIAVVAMSSVLAGFSHSFVQLIVLRGAGGMGSAMYTVSAQALLLASVPGEQRGRSSGLFSAGFLVGSISGPAVGGLVATWSLRAPFLIYGGLLVVPAALAAVALPAAAGRHAAATRPDRALTVLIGALRSRVYRAAASATLADGFAAMGVRSAIVPLFVHEVLHRSAFWTGLGFLAFAALNAVALLPGGRAADAVGRRPTIIIGCPVFAGGMVLLALLPVLWGYLVALAVSGLGSGLLDVAPSAMIGDILTGRDATLVASYQMAGDAGTVVGPLAAGALVDADSYAGAFWPTAAVLGLAAVLGFSAPETRPRDRLAADRPGHRVAEEGWRGRRRDGPKSRSVSRRLGRSTRAGTQRRRRALAAARLELPPALVHQTVSPTPVPRRPRSGTPASAVDAAEPTVPDEAEPPVQAPGQSGDVVRRI